MRNVIVIRGMHGILDREWCIMSKINLRRFFTNIVLSVITIFVIPLEVPVRPELQTTCPATTIGFTFVPVGELPWFLCPCPSPVTIAVCINAIQPEVRRVNWRSILICKRLQCRNTKNPMKKMFLLNTNAPAVTESEMASFRISVTLKVTWSLPLILFERGLFLVSMHSKKFLSLTLRKFWRILFLCHRQHTDR